MKRKLVFVLAAVVGSSACGAGDPAGQTWPPSTDAGQTTQPPVTDDQTPQTVTLTVNPLSQTTVCYDSLMVTGTATPGSDVYAIGGAATSDIRVALPGSGSFCIDVPLRKNQTQQIEVQARHPEYGIAPAKTLTVTHDASACGDSTEPAAPSPDDVELVNVAYGAPVKSKDAPDENPPGNITDESLDSWTSWESNGWWPWSAYDGWVMITLEQPTPVERIEVHWRDTQGVGEQDFASEYYVLYSPADNTLGDPADTAWPQVPNGHVTDGQGGMEVFYPGGQHMQNVALFLKYNGHDSYFEKFAIAEIKIYKKEQEYTPPVSGGTPTCDAVGSGS